MIEKPREQVLLDLLSTYLSNDHVSYIQEVYEFAKEAHKGQIRRSGRDYIMHPVEVAIILAEIQQDVSTIAAGLLHDTLEDTPVTKERISDVFGSDTASLVEGVTKLGKVYFGTNQEAQAENYRKLFLAMAEDLRVVIIKLADRLHNMRTLSFLSEEKQQRIARETLDIFAPLSLRLGMAHLRWELEDLSFSYLNPDAFQKIKTLVDAKRDDRESLVNSFTERVEELLKERNVSCRVSGRPKHFYSIHLKLLNNAVEFDELYDLLGIRVLVNSIPDCYEVLGYIHSQFKPISGRFKDYIALPKPNFYQSLHTTVIGLKGKPIEVQIRTEEMEQLAEYGIAAHWRYKGDDQKEDKFKVDFDWLRQILEFAKEDAEGYLENLKLDLFTDEVYVFTPKGDVHILEKGSTVLDFAFKVHTEVGLNCIGATVNGSIVPLSYTLDNGDRIFIRTGKESEPKVAWLSFAQSRHAKSKIKSWFRKQNNEENVQKGRVVIERTLAEYGVKLKAFETSDIFVEFLEKNNIKHLDECALMVAYGELSIQSIITQCQVSQKKDVTKNYREFLDKTSKKRRKDQMYSPVKVMGEEGVSTHLAKCCNPIPGDDIIGFITIGHGVSVHRVGCHNVTDLSETLYTRVVDVEWHDHMDLRSYPVCLHIEAFDRPELMSDIVKVILNSSHNLVEMTSQPLKGGQVIVKITIQLESLIYLTKVKSTIMDVRDVICVYRPKTG